MTLRAAIIGFGLSGRTFHMPLLRASGFEVAAVGVRKAEGRTPVEDVPFVSVDRVLSDPAVDLVVVTSPNALHAEHGLQAIAAGKHVVIEKPLAAAPADAEALQRAAAASSRVVSVFHSRRWDGDFLTLKQLAETGAVGDWAIFESRWRMNKAVAQRRWKDRDDQGGGLLNDFMPHLIDQALHLFGLPDRADLDQSVQREAGAGADYVAVTLAYGHRRAVLQADCFGFQPSPRFRLAGPSGDYVCDGIDPQEGQLRAGLVPGAPDFGVSAATRRSTVAAPSGEARPVPIEAGRYAAFYDGLRLAIEAGAPPPVPVADAARVVGLIAALQGKGRWTPD